MPLFTKKVWKNRMSEYPTRRKLTKENGTTELVTVARSEGSVSQEGDAFSAENMNNLEERILKAIGSGDIPKELGTDIISAITALNTHLQKASYAYEVYADVILYGMVSKKQTDSYGRANRYIIFIPSMSNPYMPYGVKKIKALVIQGIVVLRENEQDANGFQLVDAFQNRQGLHLSIHSDAATDISGYLCMCMFDFLKG